MRKSFLVQLMFLFSAQFSHAILVQCPAENDQYDIFQSILDPELMAQYSKASKALAAQGLHPCKAAFLREISDTKGRSEDYFADESNNVMAMIVGDWNVSHEEVEWVTFDILGFATEEGSGWAAEGEIPQP